MRRLFLIVALVTVSFTGYAQVNLNLGLRAYYNFNGNANDQSGNGNNPIFNNTTYTTDRLGNPNSAVHFDGSTNYIRIPNSPSINTNNQISLCVWVKPMGFYQGTCHGNSIMMKGDNDFLTGNYLLRFDDNFYTNGANCSTSTVDENHQNFYGVGTNPGFPGYTPYIQTGEWYSVIYTYDGSTARLYVNCQLMVSEEASGLTFTNTYDLFLGKLNRTNYNYWLNADMDEVRIYDRAINEDEVRALAGCPTAITNCSNWLKTQNPGESVTIGDLDISGNQITVECIFNRTSPWSGNYLFAGDLVSKHDIPSNVNYLLRPNSAEITTSNGYYVTPSICPIELNKTYHAALVYNGSTLKFYRNGFLMSQVAATGNLINNDLITTIGDYAFNNPVGTNFQGYINEVRIWNVARTQSELRSYLTNPLPSPATQPGLVAYYTFENLINKQGNPAWDGILNGAASINQTNPNCTLIADSCNLVIPVTSFIAPDTVCTNTNVQVQNTSTGATSYYWTFCEFNTNTPIGTNLGNFGGQLQTPVFADLVKDNNGNYFAFVSNNSPGGITRLSYGSSLLNTPTATNLGNFGNIIPTSAEGVQVVQVNGNWTVIMVGGEGINSRILKLDFGASLSNTPSATNWGNLGALSYPHDLHLFTENNQWYAYTVNANSSTITRFDFGFDFSNPPSATNLGNIGSLSTPVGIGVIKQAGNWHVFVTNAGNSTITRFDFGNSLLNTASAFNIGNIANISNPRDISFINLCDGIQAFVVNANGNSMTRLNFGTDITSTPSQQLLGGFGSLSFPHSITEWFREGNDIYALIPNANTNALTSIQFAGCSGLPSSSLQNPPAVTYTTPGTYNITLITDIGLPTQNSFCETIVVGSIATSTSNVSICPNQFPYNWNGQTITTAGTYSTTIPIPNGCDSIANLNLSVLPVSSSLTNLNICPNQTPYNWNGQNITASGTYNATLINTNGCDSIATLNLTINQASSSTNNISICNNQLPYLWNGQNITSAGTYTANLINANGCDSIATLNLAINQTSSSQTNINTCASSLPINWNGQSISTAGTYTATLLNSAGCDSIATLNLTIQPNSSSQTNVSICSSQAPYTWNGQSYSNTGQYSVAFPVGNGCDSIANLNLTVNPVRTSQTQVAICNGQLPYLWNGQSYNSPGNYSVTLAGSNGCDSIASLVLSIGTAATTQETLQRCRAQLPLNWNGQILTGPGTYSATLSTAAGCDSVVNLSLTVFNDPVVATIADSSICPGQSITLETQGAATYQWSPATGLSNPGIASPSFTGTNSQQYVVTGTDANGCTDTDTLNIEVKNLAGLQAPSDASMCRYDSVRLDGNNGSAYTYQWAPAIGLSDPNIESPMASPESTQLYQVTVTDSICGIGNNFTVRVTVRELPNVQASKSNDITCQQRQSRLRAQGANTYTWSPATALNQTNIPNPTANPTNQTTYTVTGTDANGCSNTDSVTINVLTSLAAYGIPTAFTPNNDGLNDCFGIRYWGDTRDFQLVIWNRYGEKVFETKQSADCWDGTYKGRPADPGTYVYLVEGITGCGKISKRSNLVLIR